VKQEEAAGFSGRDSCSIAAIESTDLQKDKQEGLVQVFGFFTHAIF